MLKRELVYMTSPLFHPSNNFSERSPSATPPFRRLPHLRIAGSSPDHGAVSETRSVPAGAPSPVSTGLGVERRDNSNGPQCHDEQTLSRPVLQGD